jgi:hypothetical protein
VLLLVLLQQRQARLLLTKFSAHRLELRFVQLIASELTLAWRCQLAPVGHFLSLLEVDPRGSGVIVGTCDAVPTVSGRRT